MRVLCCAVIAAIAASAAISPAFGRGRVTLAFRIDLTRDTANPVAAPSLASAALTTPRTATPMLVSYDNKQVVVRTAAGTDVIRLGVGKLDGEWMPWSILQPGVLVFDWRERVVVPEKQESTRDVIRGVDLATGTELWRRDTPGAIAGAVGDRLLVLNTGGRFALVDSRTGKTVRRLALAGSGPSTLAISGGDTLVDTGDVLARIDAKGTITWKVTKLGAVDSIVPIAEPAARYIVDPQAPASPLPATGDWIVQTAGHLGRLDAANGKVRWLAPSTSTSLVVDGAEVFVAEVARDPVAPAAIVTLVARDLATGKTTHDVRLGRQADFYDRAEAAVVAKQGDLVEVTAEFIVLD